MSQALKPHSTTEIADPVDVRYNSLTLVCVANTPHGVSMALELTVTAKGQVTLRREVLNHLGVKPGARVSVSLLENGRIELVATATRGDIKELRGALRRPGQRPVSLEEMQEAIEAGDGR